MLIAQRAGVRVPLSMTDFAGIFHANSVLYEAQRIYEPHPGML
jgi:hypothetical protein